MAIGFALILLTSNVFADSTASSIVSEFNALNGNRGILFTPIPATSHGVKHLLIQNGSQQPSWEAYSSKVTGVEDGRFFISTFCVEPERYMYTGEDCAGTLDYADNKTTTRADGNSLNLGIAYLYAKYATGELVGYDYANPHESAYDLQGFIDKMITNTATYSTFTSSEFGRLLLSVNGDINHWLETYDPGRIYSEIGYYSVFVINAVSGAYGQNDVQDFLYVAISTPEPMTLALWGLLSTGTLGFSCIRRRKSRQNP